MSTPLQFAQQQCANYLDRACKGIGIKDDGSLFSFGAKPSCVLVNRGVRCQYFEDCVLPMGIDPSNSVNVQRRKEQQEAVHLYRMSATAGMPSLANKHKRLCPNCKSRELESRKRLCYVCSEGRKREAWKKSKEKARHVHKTPSGTPDSIG